MNDIDFDPDAVIAFSDNVMDELTYTVRPWIERIRTQLTGNTDEVDGTALHTVGTADRFGDYGGRLGIRLAADARQCLQWLTELEAGLSALSLASAVMVEKLRRGDELTAEEVELAVSMSGNGRDNGRGPVIVP